MSNAQGSSMARWRVVDFLLAIIEHFSLAVMAAALLSEICRNRRFFKGWVTLSAIFGRWGRRPQSIYGPLDRRMMYLQLCRWKFSHKETL